MKSNHSFILAVLALTAASCMKDMSYDSLADGEYYRYSGEVVEGVLEEAEPEAGGKFDKIVDNPFVNTADEAVSTFSVDCDAASYNWLRRCVRNGSRPVPSAVRIEEYINYFPYNYAAPGSGEAVALNAEVGQCPWNGDHYLMRLGMRGKTLAEDDIPQANFVFLVDVSGSMDGEDRLDLLKSSLVALTGTMRPQDRIAIVTYSGKVDKVLPSTPVSESETIVKAIKKLTASGSTNGGEAIRMAYEEAVANYIEGGNNRVIMGTDGDFNVGVTSTDALLEMVQNYAAKGIYLTICGFGYGNFNDSMMEKVSNKGNGTYEYIANSDDMEKVFIRERAKFTAVANDCKVQVTFNPAVVKAYRLIGYENRKMSNDDFENDGKDAAEIGSGQCVTALYELDLADGSDPSLSFARFDMRYKTALGEDSRLIGMDVVDDGCKTKSDDFYFAAAVASFGMIMRGSEYKGTSDLTLVKELAEKGSDGFDPYNYRKNFISLVGNVKNQDI